MFHTCWTEKQAAWLELVLLFTAAFSVSFHGTQIGVRPYSAGSSSALNIIGSSCCLGREGSGLIQLKRLASSSETPPTDLPVPGWYCPSRSWQEREEVEFTPHPALRGSGMRKGASIRILLAPTMSFPWLEESWDSLYSVETFGTISSFVLLLWLLLSKSCRALWNVRWMYFPLFPLNLLMGSFKEDKHHGFTHFRDGWINPDSGRF